MVCQEPFSCALNHVKRYDSIFFGLNTDHSPPPSFGLSANIEVAFSEDHAQVLNKEDGEMKEIRHASYVEPPPSEKKCGGKGDSETPMVTNHKSTK
jgi:hypothetical protein